MNKKGNVPTWIFGILLIYFLILAMSIFFGRTIITNSDQLVSMYGENPTIWDSMSMVIQISTFQLIGIIPFWISLLMSGLSIIVVLGVIFVLRGVS